MNIKPKIYTYCNSINICYFVYTLIHIELILKVNMYESILQLCTLECIIYFNLRKFLIFDK